jgi:uncharacterized cupin superfamily protein
MHVIQHTALPRVCDAGAQRQTIAGAALGDLPFDVELRHLEAGASTVLPARVARGAVIVLAGCGKLRLEGGVQAFHAPCTLILPAGAEHPIVNHGALAMQLVCIDARGTP